MTDSHEAAAFEEEMRALARQAVDDPAAAERLWQALGE